MTRRDITAFLLGCTFLGVIWTLSPGGADAKPQPKVTYIECDHGAHVWLFPDGGGAVLPAGADC